MKAHILLFAWTIVCATSLEAMDPSPAEDVSAQGRIKRHDLPLNAIYEWAQKVALSIDFHKDNDGAQTLDSEIYIPPLNSWMSAPDKPLVWYDDLDECQLPLKQSDLADMTFEGLIQCVTDLMSAYKDEMGADIPGILKVSARLSLQNLSNTLPKDVRLPHVRRLSLQGTHFSGLDAWDLPDLLYLETRCAFAYYHQALSRPPLCALSSKALRGDMGGADFEPLVLNLHQCYGLPAFFKRPMDEGRIALENTPQNGVIFQNAGRLLGHGDVGIPGQCSTALPLSVYAKGHNPLKGCGVQPWRVAYDVHTEDALAWQFELPLYAIPRGKPPASPKTFSEEGLVVTDDGLYALPRFNEEEQSEEEQIPQFVPTEVVEYMLEFCDPLTLLKCIWAFNETPLEDYPGMVLGKKPRPAVRCAFRGFYDAEILYEFPFLEGVYKGNKNLNLCQTKISETAWITNLSFQEPKDLSKDRAGGDPSIPRFTFSTSCEPVFKSAKSKAFWAELKGLCKKPGDIGWCEKPGSIETSYALLGVLFKFDEQQKVFEVDSVMDRTECMRFYKQHRLPYISFNIHSTSSNSSGTTRQWLDADLFHTYDKEDPEMETNQLQIALMRTKVHEMVSDCIGLKITPKWFFKNGFEMNFGDFFLQCTDLTTTEEPQYKVLKELTIQELHTRVHAVTMDNLFAVSSRRSAASRRLKWTSHA